MLHFHCGTLKKPNTIPKEEGMKLLVLWLSCESMGVVGHREGDMPPWDVRVQITLHFGAKVQKQKTSRSTYRVFVV